MNYMMAKYKSLIFYLSYKYPMPPSKIKKPIYIFLFTLLGLMVSFLAHAGAEITYILYAFKKGIVLQNHFVFGNGYCVLPVWLQVGLVVVGVVGGFWMGIRWWQIIYVEKRFEPWYKRILTRF